MYYKAAEYKIIFSFVKADIWIIEMHVTTKL